MNKKIQIMRGLSIIAVIVIHTYASMGGYGVIIRPFVNFAVGMFIFLRKLQVQVGHPHE